MPSVNIRIRSPGFASPWKVCRPCFRKRQAPTRAATRLPRAPRPGFPSAAGGSGFGCPAFAYRNSPVPALSKVKRRCEHRRPCPAEDREQGLVDVRQEFSRLRPKPDSSSTSARWMAVTSAARTPCPITSQMKTPASVVRERQHMKKIAAHGAGRQIARVKCQRALAGRRILRKRGKLLRQERLLDLARHVQVVLELHVFFAQLLIVHRELLLGPFPLGDVPSDARRSPMICPSLFRSGTLVVESHCFWPSGMHDRFLPVHDCLARSDDALVVGLEADCAVVRKKIEHGLAYDILRVLGADRAHVGKVIEPIDAAHILDINGIQQVIDHAAQEVPFLRQLAFRGDPLERVADRAHKQVRVGPAFHQVILGAAPDRLDSQGFVVQARSAR